MRTFETARLLLRPPTGDDLDALAEIYANPEVMRFIGKGARSREETRLAIERMQTGWERDGHGMWLAFAKDTGALAGRVGLAPLEDTGEVEVGYLFAKRFWGQGLATESARVALGFGFGEVALERVVGVAHPDNHASRRVLEKLGMRYQREAFHYGAPVAYYAIGRGEFLP